MSKTEIGTFLFLYKDEDTKEFKVMCLESDSFKSALTRFESECIKDDISYQLLQITIGS